MKHSAVVVIGAGPAGLAAAVEAARAGAQVLLVDENARPGGQLFKQIHKFFGSQQHYAGTRGFEIGRQMLAQAQELGVEIWLDTVAWGVFDHRVAVIREGRSRLVEANAIILATGAFENALNFPGWTLPGVITAGALQTMMNIQRVLPGQRILMVGAGNIGLIVSYQALQAGADVVAVVEARDRIGGYGVHAAKIRRAGVPILLQHSVARANGEKVVQSATIAGLDSRFQPLPGTEETLEVDLICLAIGLTPLTELAWNAGCRFTYIPQAGGHVPLRDENMQTTVPGLYVAGDMTGIEEANTAIESGRLAGIAATEALGHLTAAEAEQRKAPVRSWLRDLRLGEVNASRRQVQEILCGACEVMEQELVEKAEGGQA